jgi:YfiH family protein
MTSDVLSDGPFRIGFGRRGQTLDELLPGHRWATLHQVHSNKVVRQPTAHPGVEPQADAHYTFESGLGLAVKTADCLPILIGGNGVIAAIHAGWRGVETDIIAETLSAIEQERPTLLMSSLRVWIGPHIRQQSFEAGTDVANRLLSAAEKADKRRNIRGHQPDPIFAETKLSLEKDTAEKRWVDLETIARIQLTSFGIPNQKIVSVGIDTVSDHGWSSFRRDREQAGRNLSFITATW